MRRDMTATVITLVMNTVMMTAVLSGCGGTPKETVPKTAKKQKAEVRTVDTTGESGRDEESSTEAASGSHEDKTIGFMGMTSNSKYHITLASGVKVEAETKGVRIEVQAGDQHANIDVQLGITENMIANKMDGVLLILSSSDGLEPALIKCKEAGILIINLDTKLTDENLVNVDLDIPFYGTNSYGGAELAGEYITKDLEKRTKTAILKGIKGQAGAVDCYSGLIEGAGDTVIVVAEQTASWEVGQGYTAVQNIIDADPDVEFFFCCNDSMGIGVLRTTKETNMQEQIQIIGFDAVSEALNLVENGKFLVTVVQYPAEMGEPGVDNTLKIFDGDEAESYIDTGTEVITKNNVGELKDYLKTFEQEQGWNLAKDFSYGIRTYSRP